MKAETTYPAIIGRVIANMRAEKRMDQNTAAEKAGINRSTWSRIENGDSAPDAIQLSKIAHALECSTGDIMIAADKAHKSLTENGVKVHMTVAKSKASTGLLAMLGAAALGALVYGFTQSKSDTDSEEE